MLTELSTAINYLFSFYFYATFAGFTIAHFNLDLGLIKLWVTFLNKLFTLVEKNENELFFSIEKKSGLDVNGNNQNGDKSAYQKYFTEPEPNAWNLLKSSWTCNDGLMVAQLSLIGKFLFYTGQAFRLIILFPVRLALFIIAILYMISILTIIAYILPYGKFRDSVYKTSWNVVFRLANLSFSGIINFHGQENLSKGGGIYISNHTGPTDIISLGNHSCYGFLGRRREGFLGFVYNALEDCGGHYWFSLKDKDLVKSRLMEKVKNTEVYPMVIFPEGTCTPSDRIMRFKKGAFELDCNVYPIAIKYDTRFGSPFWNSRKANIFKFALHLLTNWALVVDINFLPPMAQRSNEDAIQFAERVRNTIAEKIGLKKIDLDGYAVKYGLLNGSVESSVPGSVKQKCDLAVK